MNMNTGTRGASKTAARFAPVGNTSAAGDLKPVDLKPFSADQIKWLSTGSKAQADIRNTVVALGQAFQSCLGIEVKNISMLQPICYGKVPENARYSTKDIRRPLATIILLRTQSRQGMKVSLLMGRELTREEEERGVAYYNKPPKPEPQIRQTNDANIVLAPQLVASRSDIPETPASTPIPVPTIAPVSEPAVTVTAVPTTEPMTTIPARESATVNTALGTAGSDETSHETPVSDEAGGRTDSELRGFYSFLLEQHPLHPDKLPVDVISTLVKSLFDSLKGRGDVGNFYRAYVVPFAMKISGDTEAWSFDWPLVQSYVDGAPRPQKSLRDVRMRLLVPANATAPSSGSSVQDFAQRVKLSRNRPSIQAGIDETVIRLNELSQLIEKLKAEQQLLQAEQQQLSAKRDSLAVQLQQATLSKEDQDTLEALKAALAWTSGLLAWATALRHPLPSSEGGLFFQMFWHWFAIWFNRHELIPLIMFSMLKKRCGSLLSIAMVLAAFLTISPVGVATPTASAATVFTATTDNPYRASLSAEYIVRIDKVVASILARGQDLTQDKYIVYLGAISSGIKQLGEREVYANNAEVKNLINYTDYEITAIKTKLSRGDLFLNDLVALVNNSLSTANGTNTTTGNASNGTSTNTNASSSNASNGNTTNNGSSTANNGSSSTTTNNNSSTTTGSNSNSKPGYLVVREYAAEYCKIKFRNEAFTTINQNIPQALDSACVANGGGRCLISKFNWVFSGNIINEDRQSYWGRNGWIVDNIRCTADTTTASTGNGTTGSVDSSTAYSKNKTKRCIESEKAFYWFDSNNQKTDLIQSCGSFASTRQNGGLSCSESYGGCCPAGQIAMNGKCITPADAGGSCYATSGCKDGLSCTNGTCKTAPVVTYKYESRVTECGCSGESEYSGTKVEYFECKASDGSRATGNQCGASKDPVVTACTMPKSCSTYQGLVLEYPSKSIYEGEGMSVTSAKITKCNGQNCSQIDIPRSDLKWSLSMVVGGAREDSPDAGLIFYREKLFGRLSTKTDWLGGGHAKMGDVFAYDMEGLYLDGRRELIVGVTVKDPTKYPSTNAMYYSVTIDIKDRFDAKLRTTQGIFGGYGVARMSIDLLGEDGYNEPGNAGLYYFNGTCTVESSSATVTPGIVWLDYNNGPIDVSRNLTSRVPSSRFKITGLEQAPVGTRVDVSCTLFDTKTSTTRTIGYSETKK